MPRLTIYLLFATLFAGVGAIAWDLGQRGAAAYERMLVTRVQQGLQVLELDWARVEADGLKISLYGHAPDLLAQELALDSARATAPVAEITNYMTASLAPPPKRDPIAVELHRDSRGITLTGQFAGQPMQARMTRLLQEHAPELTIRDLTGTQAARPGRDWGPEIEIAAIAAASLPNASVRIVPGRVRVEGQAPDAETRDILNRALTGAGGDTIVIEQTVRIPLKVIAPFTFAVVKEIDGTLLIESCAVRDSHERGAIIDLLAPYGATISDATCPVGLGGPLDDWAGAIGAGLDALAHLPAGRFELEYRTASLTAYPPTSPLDFEPVEARLTQAMPAGFSTRALVQADDVAAKTEIARSRYWLRLSAEDHRIALAGRLPGKTAETALVTYAAALFGAGQVDSAVQFSDDAPPRGWQQAALELLSILRETNGGEAELANGRVSLRTRVAGPVEAAALHRSASARLDGYALETRLHVDMAAAWAAMPMPPPRCAEMLNRIVLETPFEFDPGSAVLSEENTPIIDRMQDALARCRDGRIEVGGHTDADGSETFNLRLSLSRARAVAEALVARGVAPGYLTAHGYGETQPIADNDTQSGRAQNRRIEFRALEN